MDTKSQTIRKSNRQMVAESLSPKLEEHRSHRKVAICNSYASNPGKNTRVISLPPAPIKDRKYPSLEPVNSSPSKIAVRNEPGSARPSKKFSRKFEPLTPPPLVEAQNSDIYLQKRPIKLAPLNLPEEVKEAQLKKMKDEVYLPTKSYKQIDKTVNAINDRPTKRAPLNKVGMMEESGEIKVENILPKDSKGLQDCHRNITPLSGNAREGMLSSSTFKLKSGQVHNMVPKIVSVDSTNVSVKGRFNHTKSHNTNHSIPKPIKVNRLTID
ncbi:uncharacterized protein [Pyxicephalus adspersus]|uniref:uncharacterized protein n=1 Tax=Pyxicephalus adspersus TaxID=30357 RepID=UPI003B5A9C8C